ncbi:hypothetical protein [Saccharibacillus alkalitolerans]|uniref:Uncharacterized protein n=1 Tax=Saccharibacillus alkalitolerans TaxID=2705290 RepID=A0ABX0FBS0_9BACL|nr:hypothetical protein [Saccharibacillus alkalitolerans]NGZ76919.1 hypothetical protein [Saccharibacillus alkalitolerans]
MDKILAILILGMGLTGALLMILVTQWFNSPVGNVLKIMTAVSALLFIGFAVSVRIVRRRFDAENGR